MATAYWIEFLIDDVINEIMDLLTDREVHTLALAIPSLLERLPRMEWIVTTYRITHPYSCHLCHLRFEYTTLYNFHMTRDHGPKTREEILAAVNHFFTLGRGTKRRTLEVHPSDVGPNDEPWRYTPVTRDQTMILGGTPQ